MAKLLNGRELAASLRHELKAKVANLNFLPKLGVVLVGNDPASHLYVNLKEKAAADVGIAVEKALFTEEATITTVTAKLAEFNSRPDIHGILVQLPLPGGLNEHEVIAAMNSQKDADGFHPDNLKQFLRGSDAITPGVSEGIVRLIELAGVELAGRTAALVVNSAEFAQPLIKLLSNRGVQANVVPKPKADVLLRADIIITAIGKPKIIRSEHVKDGAIIIDVGTTKIVDRVVGDVAGEDFANRDVYLTPVPGGVGPMTVAMLLWNVYRLAVQHPRSPA